MGIPDQIPKIHNTEVYGLRKENTVELRELSKSHWLTLVILTLKRQRQEDFKFEAVWAPYRIKPYLRTAN